MNGASSSSIGVFDSGVGGLSVLRELHRLMPDARLHYVADSAHAPYGERSDAYVIERSLAITRRLIEAGPSAVVVACNTATALAIGRLRDTWPALPFIGVEPGLKPAAATTRNGRIGVLATPATLASKRFERLRASQAQQVAVIAQPCPGLAALIEEIDISGPAIEAAVQAFCRPLVEADVDTVVLGCTHYAFVMPQIQAALGASVRIIDTAHAVALQTQRMAGTLTAPSPRNVEPVHLMTTGGLPSFERVTRQLWPSAVSRDHIDID